MTGLEMLKQATEVMIVSQGKDATVRLEALMTLIDLAIKQDQKR